MEEPVGVPDTALKRLEKLDGALLAGMMAETHRIEQASRLHFWIAREIVEITEQQNVEDSNDGIRLQIYEEWLTMDKWINIPKSLHTSFSLHYLLCFFLLGFAR